MGRTTVHTSMPTQTPADTRTRHVVCSSSGMGRDVLHGCHLGCPDGTPRLFLVERRSPSEVSDPAIMCPITAYLWLTTWHLFRSPRRHAPVYQRREQCRKLITCMQSIFCPTVHVPRRPCVLCSFSACTSFSDPICCSVIPAYCLLWSYIPLHPLCHGLPRHQELLL